MHVLSLQAARHNPHNPTAAGLCAQPRGTCRDRDRVKARARDVPRGLLAAQGVLAEQLQALRAAEAAVGGPAGQQRLARPPVQLQPL